MNVGSLNTLARKSEIYFELATLEESHCHTFERLKINTSFIKNTGISILNMGFVMMQLESKKEYPFMQLIFRICLPVQYLQQFTKW